MAIKSTAGAKNIFKLYGKVTNPKNPIWAIENFLSNKLALMPDKTRAIGIHAAIPRIKMVRK